MSEKQTTQIILWKQHDGYEFIVEIDPEDFPFEAIRMIAKVLSDNKHKHGVGKWKSLSSNEHIDHAEKHLVLLGHPNQDEPHLHHALTRLAMAVDVITTGEIK